MLLCPVCDVRHVFRMQWCSVSSPLPPLFVWQLISYVCIYLYLLPHIGVILTVWVALLVSNKNQRLFILLQHMGYLRCFDFVRVFLVFVSLCFISLFLFFFLSSWLYLRFLLTFTLRHNNDNVWIANQPYVLSIFGLDKSTHNLSKTLIFK